MFGRTLLNLLVNKKIEGELYTLMRKHFPSKYFPEELTQQPHKKAAGIFDFFYSNSAARDAQAKADNNSNTVWNSLFGK